jgi:hypothetical protein
MSIITARQIIAFTKASKQNYKVKTAELRHPINDEPLGDYMVYREDVKGDDGEYPDTHLASFKTGMKEGYTVVQNKNANKVLVELSTLHDMELITGGTWRNGAMAWSQFMLGTRSDSIFTVGSRSTLDIVQKRLTLVNCHDGSKSLMIMVTPFRLCNETQLNPALSYSPLHSNTCIKIRHTSNVGERMDELAEGIRVIDGVLTETAELYNELASMPVTRDLFAEVLEKLFPTRNVKNKRALANSLSMIEKVGNAFLNPAGVPISYPLFNGWNLYTAIQSVHQHQPQRACANEAYQHESTIMGTVQKNSQMALDIVHSTISPHRGMRVGNITESIKGYLQTKSEMTFEK